MKTIETTAIVAASPEEVWEALVDFDAYAEWNPFVTAAEGDPTVGERLRIRIAPPGGRAMTFRPVVTATDPGQRLEWLGRLGVRGLFDGRHEFRLSELDDGRTELVHRETFGGLLVGPLLNEASIRAGFRAMNDALKTRVEQADVAGDGITGESVAV